MSDNLRRFNAIKKALTNLYPFEPKGNLSRRLHTLAAIINGIVGSSSSKLPNIADKQGDNNKNESRIKSYTRWLQNEYVNYEVFFLPLLQILINSFSNQTLFLAIAGSVVGRGCMCLMISLIYKNRALPLSWIVVKQKQGHLPESLHIELLKMVKKIIPSDTKVVLLGDGEFDGTDFQQLTSEFDWEYVYRTAQHSVLYENKEKFNFDQLMPSGIDDFFSIPDVEFTKNKYGPFMLLFGGKKDIKNQFFC